jgi:hypothetical protein
MRLATILKVHTRIRRVTSFLAKLSQSPGSRYRVAAAVTRPVQCIARLALNEGRLDHAADQRAGGNGDRLRFLILSHSGRRRARHEPFLGAFVQDFETAAFSADLLVTNVPLVISLPYCLF